MSDKPVDLGEPYYFKAVHLRNGSLVSIEDMTPEQAREAASMLSEEIRDVWKMEPGIGELTVFVQAALALMAKF